MEVQVWVQGPDTLHPILVEAEAQEDPRDAFAAALEQGTGMLQIGKASFRTDRVLAIVVRSSYGKSGGDW